MALGLGAGLIWEASATVYPPIVNPYGLPHMILWWDFTDTTQLFQEVDSFTTAANSNNDKIGRVKNKAITDSSPLTQLIQNQDDFLGLFGRADVDGKRPTFKTGGANGYGYAQFTASSSTHLYMKQASGFGVHTGTQLMDNPIFGHQWTMVIVAQADDNDTDGTEEHVWGWEATVDADTDKRIRVYESREDGSESGTAAHKIIINGDSTNNAYGATTTVDIQMANTTNTDMNTALEVRILSTTLAAVGNLGVAQRGLNSVGSLPAGYDLLAAAAGSNRTFTFEESTNNAGFAVGTSWTGGGLVGKYFDGKIYEVLMFRGANSQDTCNGIAWYFKNKYGIDISGAN